MTKRLTQNEKQNIFAKVNKNAQDLDKSILCSSQIIEDDDVCNGDDEFEINENLSILRSHINYGATFSEEALNGKNRRVFNESIELAQKFPGLNDEKSSKNNRF